MHCCDARWQPGPRSPHGCGGEARILRNARPHRLQGDRGRLSLGIADRIRFHAPPDRGGPDPGRTSRSRCCASAGKTWSPARSSHSAARRTSSSTCTTPPRPRSARYVFGAEKPAIVKIATEAVSLMKRADAPARRRRDAPPAGVFAGKLHQHRTRFRARNLRSGHRRLGAVAARTRSSSTFRPRSNTRRRTSTPTRSSGCAPICPGAT